MINDIIKQMTQLAKERAQTLPDEEALNVPYLYPAWKSSADYTAGDRRNHNGTLYKCLQPHTSQDTWTPDASPSLWAEVLVPDPGKIPEWKQPDSTNAYNKGDKVTHNGTTWESIIDNNVWEPGAVGTESLWRAV